ncbi:MAG TPA: hypothetical protein H9815_16110 [Candidatus Ruania gallistercoris]|uniref:Uncharacterized protein n=1 Tax=Candidatus Ruania gallistercoris TaxID=2838746 RepID=A0A9D2EHQ8_9MICO|nr:hypothetical protein [Candidatus Ruania gallistercoris]
MADWGPTRPADAVMFALIALGCLGLAAFAHFARAATIIATGSYVAFALGDYELGMFLPPMIVIFALVARTRHRLAAIVCAFVSLAAALVWVARRADPIDDAGTTLLVWVAFATTLAVFFMGPLLVGEIVRLRMRLGSAGRVPDEAVVTPPPGPAAGQ